MPTRPYHNIWTCACVRYTVTVLALEEPGYTNVVSVPDGAPMKVKEGDLPAPEEDVKYQYLWNCREHLDPVRKIVIATDADAPGQVHPNGHAL
eukprot:3741564-Pyramimonas_sp.AAC.1